MRLVASTEFHCGSRLYSVDSVLPAELADQVLQVFETPELWHPAPEFAHTTGRLGLTESNSAVDQLREYLAQPEFAEQVSSILGQRVKYLDLSLWSDQPGFIVTEHRDLDLYGYALQLYLAPAARERLNQPVGTVFFTEDHRPVFELAYRHNSGYLIDRTYTLNHGMTRPAVESRYSVYIRLAAVDS